MVDARFCKFFRVHVQNSVLMFRKDPSALNLLKGKVKNEFLVESFLQSESEYNNSQSEKTISSCVRNVTPGP